MRGLSIDYVCCPAFLSPLFIKNSRQEICHESLPDNPRMLPQQGFLKQPSLPSDNTIESAGEFESNPMMPPRKIQKQPHDETPLHRRRVMNVRVVLVCQEGKARQVYIDAIRSLGAQVDTAPSFNALSRLMYENAYNGVIVDLKTKTESSFDEKESLQTLLDQFPTAQVKLEEETETVRVLSFGREHSCETVAEFINTACRSFAARPIRASVRKDIHFSALISKTGGLPEGKWTRTVTMNISQGGCFVYSIDRWKIGSTVSIVLKELKDQQPITGQVRWQLPWGETMQVPGIGVKFEQISTAQLSEIGNKCTF